MEDQYLLFMWSNEGTKKMILCDNLGQIVEEINPPQDIGRSDGSLALFAEYEANKRGLRAVVIDWMPFAFRLMPK